MKKTVLMMMMVLAASSLFAGGKKETGSSGAYTIEASGSTSVAPLMEKLAEKYREIKPEIRINVSGTGSGVGITGANTGVSELGMSSRNLKSSEMGFGLDVLTIAVDAIAVIVHPDNPVSALSLAQIKGIYTGEINNWEQVGGNNNPIAVVSREPGSGTRGAFEDVVGFVDRLVAGAIEFDGTGGVRAAVAGNVNAIGYISLGSINTEVKTLEVNGVKASSENVINGKYAVARPFLVLYRENRINPATREFLGWVLSGEAQAIVAKNYVPVK